VAKPVGCPSGTEAYDAEADARVRQYESIAFADVHKAILGLLRPPPARVLDIGAGIGRDAAGFAELGYSVTAIEPTAVLRQHAMRLHPSPGIEWLDDSRPDLSVISAHGAACDVVMLTTVWTHLDEVQRRRAMPRVAALVRPGGVMALSQRHGPIPVGRRMFDIAVTETIDLANCHGLTCVHRTEHRDGLLRRPGVSWDRRAVVRTAA
jgi:2-polyprenyl-3-methyl-5-hydroxy-6-metoxy-1,4-benzoquinol methylase